MRQRQKTHAKAAFSRRFRVRWLIPVSLENAALVLADDDPARIER